MTIQILKENVNNMLATGNVSDLATYIDANKETAKYDGDLSIIWYLSFVVKKELAAGETIVYSKVSSVDELVHRFTMLKFILRRMEFGILTDNSLLLEFLQENNVSMHELLGVIDSACPEKEKVLSLITRQEL